MNFLLAHETAIRLGGFAGALALVVIDRPVLRFPFRGQEVPFSVFRFPENPIMQPRCSQTAQKVT